MNKNETKKLILQVGAELVHKKGFNNTGIQEILDLTGIPKGSFYFYFKSKEDFGLNLIEYYISFFLEKMNSHINNGDFPYLKRLENAFDEFINGFKTKCYSGGCPIGRLSSEMADLSDAFRQKLKEGFNRMEESIEQFIKLAQENYEISNKIDCKELSHFIINSWEGVFIRMKLSKDDTSYENFKYHIFKMLLKETFIMNNIAIEQKLRLLKSYPEINPESADRFVDILKGLSDWDLYRINPLRFAEKHNFNKVEATDLFIYSAKIGMFDFEWNMICPFCGAVTSSHDSIGDVERQKYYCALCDVDVETDLSNYVEVAFNIDKSIKQINIDPFANAEDYFNYFFSGNVTHSQRMREIFEKYFLKGYYPIKSDETKKINFKANPNEVYKVKSIDIHSKITLEFTNEISQIPQIIDIDILPSGFSPTEFKLPAGNITVNVKSHLNRTCGVELFYQDARYLEEFNYEMNNMAKNFKPFLTGKALLNNQSFRDLFRIQTLPRDLQLKVSNVTILFTDLKGSTELYEKTGDMYAYNLVQEHFNLLKQSTKKYSGAIVKTIGDAIMASFSSPIDGIQAALDMMKQIRIMNENLKNKTQDISIKVGLHSGTALAVTANEALDYFGQTVNMAARVQGLAEGGEIWVTEPILGIEDTNTIFEANGYKIEKKSALLKGVSSPTTVFRCVA